MKIWTFTEIVNFQTNFPHLYSCLIETPLKCDRFTFELNSKMYLLNHLVNHPNIISDPIHYGSNNILKNRWDFFIQSQNVLDLYQIKCRNQKIWGSYSTSIQNFHNLYIVKDEVPQQLVLNFEVNKRLLIDLSNLPQTIINENINEIENLEQLKNIKFLLMKFDNFQEIENYLEGLENLQLIRDFDKKYLK